MRTGRNVVVTGATGGMGAIFAQRFIANGETDFATDTSDEALKVLSGRIDSDRLHIQKADISDEGEVSGLADLTRRHNGRVDVLVNAAGHFPIQKFLDMAASDWRKVIDINLNGTALIRGAILPLMLGRGWGRIVNVGSASVYSGVDGQYHYVAAKSGVIGLSHSLAREFGGKGITVNVVAPGATITESARRTLPENIQGSAIKARYVPGKRRPVI
jgi:NAD(P)-dependent dehydrogenase (short-subunit alcohol dehydrogenase family)